MNDSALRPHVEVLEDRYMLSTVEIYAAGTVGGETFDVLIEDEVVATYSLLNTDQAIFTYESDSPLVTGELKVQFTSDFVDEAAGLDSNLIIDKVVIDGVTYQTEHPATFSTGSYTAEGLSHGMWQTEYLHTNGFFQYSDQSAVSTIEVYAYGATGEEQFLLDINGAIVLEADVTNEPDLFSVELNGVVSPEQDIVRVEYTNDLFVAGEVDRNLLVDRIVVNGTIYESESPLTYSTGTWVDVGVPHEGFLQSETLHVTGYFEYSAATDVTLRASGDEGVESIRLQIEEQTVAEYQLETSFVDYTYRHFTKLTPDQIRVAFFGDQYDPANDFDANANIDYIEINGERIESEAPTVFSNATYTVDGLEPGFGRGSTLQTDGFFQYAFAFYPDSFSLPEDSSNVPLAVRDNDNIAGRVDIEITSQPENGTAELVDGVIRYTPVADFSGSDTLFYRESGTSGLGVAVDINVRQSHQQPQSLIDSRLALELTPSGKFLELERLVQIPLEENGRQPRLNGMALAGERIFVIADGTVDGEGKIYELVEDESGNTAAELFLDVGQSILDNSGQLLSNFGPLYGLRGLAFHPEFGTNGKFYVSYTVPRPEDPSAFFYLSSPEVPVPVESALGEWTFDFATGQVDPGSFREVFRVAMRTLDHAIGGIAFNRFAAPGDEDYGLLYVGHGDGSEQSAIAGDGQDNDALGKIIRINPLASDDGPFSLPETNPFLEDPNFPDVVYAIGFRNPHNLSFAVDSDGLSHLIVTEIGRDNVEEINIVVAGGNYGWADREGIFVHIREQSRLNNNIANLPADEANNGYIYPVTMLGHDGEPGDSFVGQAIAGGHVIQNGSSELDGQFIFAEFATDGRAYHIDFAEALQQTTTLDPADPTRDGPDDLTWLDPQELTILFDHDSDDETAPLVRDSLRDVFDDEPDFEEIITAGKIRADVRFGQGPNGELYVMNKRNGWIYLATNTVSPD